MFAQQYDPMQYQLHPKYFTLQGITCNNHPNIHMCFDYGTYVLCVQQRFIPARFTGEAFSLKIGKQERFP